MTIPPQERIVVFSINYLHFAVRIGSGESLGERYRSLSVPPEFVGVQPAVALFRVVDFLLLGRSPEEARHINFVVQQLLVTLAD